MAVSEPTYFREGKWAVETSNGVKVFSDQETAYDFYALQKHAEQQQTNGDSPDS
jgi:hypothetical protein